MSVHDLAFNNSFWGHNDLGVGVLLERMRDAKSTNEEIRHFYAERAAIEEDYAARLLQLSKRSLGAVELGTLKNSMNALVTETCSMAAAHAAIARQVKSDLVDTHTEFAETLLTKRRKIQSNVEEVFRIKIQHQVELKKVTERMSLEAAQSSDRSNYDRPTRDRDASLQAEYTNAVDQLARTTDQWNTEWKGACDAFQSLEEERIDALKTGMWALANIFSQVCVTDDESCERLRVSLEKCDVASDIRTFIELKGTGNVIPQAPEYSSDASNARKQNLSHADYRPSPNVSPVRKPTNGASSPMLSYKKSIEDSKDNNTAINANPLDGITQLCRSDSGATFNSNATSMAGSYVTASSVYSSVPTSQRQTPNPNAGSDGFISKEVHGKLARKKSFIERVDMWPRRSPSPSKLEVAKPLKAQKTGSSIFDALRPARSRSRASMRTENLKSTGDQGTLAGSPSSQSVLNVGQNMLPIMTDEESSRAQRLNNADPIAAALEKLRMESNSPKQEYSAAQRSVAANVTSHQLNQVHPRSQHRRFPSRSESSSPILSTSSIAAQRPLSYRPVASASLGAPPAAHSAAEMRSMTTHYIQQNASMLNGPQFVSTRDQILRDGAPAGRSRATSIHSQAPGNLRRSPSPNPSAYSNQTSVTPRQSPSRRPVSAHSDNNGNSYTPRQETYGQNDYDTPGNRSYKMHNDHGSDTYQHNYGRSTNGYASNDASQTTRNEPTHMIRSSDHNRGPDNPTYNDRSSNRHSMTSSTSTRRSEQPLMRARSKSFVDAPRPRAQFTRDGRQIVAMVLALYDYQATIPEEIGFQQGDTLAITEMREDGWWVGELFDHPNPERGLVPSNFFKRIETQR